MNDASFRRLLRSALMLSIASCGGRIDSISGFTDQSSPPPAGTVDGFPGSLPSDDPPPPPPKKDAGIFDASTSKDASKDATADAGCGTIVQQDVCTATISDPCVLPPDGGGWNEQECANVCPGNDGGPSQAFGCNVSKDQSGTTMLQCYYCIVGRRPDGLAPCASATGDALGAFFADISQLEAASIDAFDRLALDLEEHGAPTDLRTRARRSVKDEIRHAKTTAKLATMFGAKPGAWSDAPTVEPRRSRTLEEIAIENATEGCVRETFGALVGMFQAERAQDETIRRAMKTIARDESRHAALSWSILEWSLGELDEDARARVERAMEDALATLERDVVFEPSADVKTLAGMPSKNEAASLVAAFQRTMPRLRNPSSTSG